MKRWVCLIGVLCLLCGSFAFAQSDAAQLAQNADFSMLDGELPADWAVDVWNGNEGGHAVSIQQEDGFSCVRIENPWENDVKLLQSIPVEGGKYYRISCEIKTVNVSGGAGANLSVYDTLAMSEGVFGTTDWQRVELSGKTQKRAERISVCVRLGGYGALSSGEAWFRNFRVEELSEKPAEYTEFYYEYHAPASDSVSSEGLNPGPKFAATLFSALAFLLLYYKLILPKRENLPTFRGDSTLTVAFILLAALLVRVNLSIVFYGHMYDIDCFMAWASTLARGGIRSFYTSGIFADYPPGYFYILWFVGKLGRLLELIPGGDGYVLLTKMPIILMDLVAALVVFRMADKRFSRVASLTLCAVVAFNPAFAFLSGGWGQVDQYLALLLLLAVLLFESDKLILAGAVYGVAIITKPQALMLGPLLAVAYGAKVADKKPHALRRMLLAVAAAIAAIFLLAEPFRNGRNMLWFVEKLLGTATSYPFASIEAFNFFALFGGNWAPVDDTFFLLSYRAWGTIFILLSCGYCAALYWRAREKRGALPLCAALLFCLLFTFGHYMHERYLFPALLLMMVAMILTGERRLFICFGLFTCTLLLNGLGAFVIVTDSSLRGVEYEAMTRSCSLVNVLGSGYFAYLAYDLLWRGNLKAVFSQPRAEKPAFSREDAQRLQKDGRMTKRDRLYCGALTLAYAIVALLNLGSTQAPQNAWIGSAGDTATVQVESGAKIAEVRVYGGLYTGTVQVAGGAVSAQYAEDNGDMFRWKTIAENLDSDTVTLYVQSGQVWFNELACFDAEGKLLPASASPGAEALVDEPDEVPSQPSYLNGMYFDELYHARTAYEHLHGIDPYENSHPPLGKVFIMLGVWLFGMNAFGWRIVGTLFGVGMVPIFHLLAKRMLRRSDYALCAAGLFAFDFMHFTQTRIATIDVYGVFFILLMFLFMYRYYCMNFFDDGLKATLKPLALAGVFFGLGAASKWICIYAGAGLAVVFFTSLAQRWGEYAKYRSSEDSAARERVKQFPRCAVLTLLWCCLFYIAIPVGIYLLSYLPYCLSEAHYDLEGIWGVQKFMFSYHSGLKATHAYSSPWWQWPFNVRPVWYYIGYEVPEGMASSISAFGNPAVWLPCAAGAIGMLLAKLRGTLRENKAPFVILVALAANYLPWVLVTRCTFAYHYFASVPFTILASMLLLREWEEQGKLKALGAYGKYVKWAWLAIAVLLFAAFYPALSGLPCGKEYLLSLEWLPSWTFLGY